MRPNPAGFWFRCAPTEKDCERVLVRYPIFSEQKSQHGKWLPVQPGLTRPGPVQPGPGPPHPDSSSNTVNPACPAPVAKSPSHPFLNGCIHWQGWGDDPHSSARLCRFITDRAEETTLTRKNPVIKPKCAMLRISTVSHLAAYNCTLSFNKWRIRLWTILCVDCFICGRFNAWMNCLWTILSVDDLCVDVFNFP